MSTADDVILQRWNLPTNTQVQDGYKNETENHTYHYEHLSHYYYS